MEWMYDGPSSTVNRDDYLTGRKIDRNFELYGSGKKEAQSVIDAVCEKRSVDPSAPKVVGGGGGPAASILDLYTIKNQDPLVSIKVQEEKIRRDILENPLRLKRLNKIVMKTIAKKLKRMRKAEVEAENSSEAGDSREGSTDKEAADAEQHHKHKQSRHRREQRRDSQSSQHKRKNEKASRKPSRSTGHRESGSCSDEEDPRHGRQQSTSSSETSSSTEGAGRRRSGAKRKEMECQEGSSRASSHEERRSRDHRRSAASRGAARDGGSSLRPGRSQLPDVAAAASSDKSNTKTKKKKRLTAEEIEKRRLEMMNNARWRQDERERHLSRCAALEQRMEINAATSAAGSGFIQKLVLKGNEDGSLEKRIRSKVQTIQRSSQVMETNFARK